MATSGRIDTHHHFVPAPYAAWLKRKGVEAGGLPIPQWSIESAIELMDKYRIQAAIMSISTPGVHLGYSLNDAQRASIDRGNAEALFARLRGARS